MFKDILRKSLHFVLGLIIIVVGLSVRNKYEVDAILLVIFASLIFFIILDYFRIEFNVKIPIYHRFIRKKEKDRFNALVHGLIATILIFTFFDFNIALAALTMAIFSDAFAALVGKQVKGPKLFKKKTIIGTTSGLIANLVIGFILLPTIILPVIMAITATLVELYVDKIDDNLAIPIFTGLVGQLLILFLL